MPTTEDATQAQVCPDCLGSGWLISDDGGAGTAKPCSCQVQRRSSLLVERAAIPPQYAGCSLSNFVVESPTARSREELLRARTLSGRYVDAFVREDGSFRASGLLFIGPPGVGKTHLAVGVLKQLIDRYGIRGSFVDFTDLVHRLQATFESGSEESKRQVLDPLRTAEVLVLDELGAQKPSAWVNDVLYLVINSRYSKRLPTLFTTNYDLEPPRSATELDRSPDRERVEARPAGLGSRIPARLVSRLYEMARPIVIQADDYRRDIKMAQSLV